MPDANSEVLWQFANDAGVEIFNLLIARSGKLGVRPFEEIVIALTGATAVCLANVLRPAVERASDPATAADALIRSCTRQTRRFLEPVVSEGTESS